MEDDKMLINLDINVEKSSNDSGVVKIEADETYDTEQHSSIEDLVDLKQEKIEIKEELSFSPTLNNCGTEHVDENVCSLSISDTDINRKPSRKLGSKHLRNKVSSSVKKPFACNVCKFKTTEKTGLKKHMFTHTGEKPFACYLCKFRSAEKNNLKKHMYTHTGEKHFACNLCEFRSAYKHILKTHMYTHIEEKPFACNFCKYRSAEKTNLKKHMYIHTGEKPFACNLCKFRSAEKNNLKRHMVTHTGEKPYVCSQCDYKCARKGNLTKHVYTHRRESQLNVPIMTCKPLANTV